VSGGKVTIKLTMVDVEIMPALSQETAAYAGTVCVNDIPQFRVSNHGTGGMDTVAPVQGGLAVTYAAARDLRDALDKHIAREVGRIDIGDGMSIPASLEVLCHSYVWGLIENDPAAGLAAKRAATLWSSPVGGHA
jgi:hypothetical protein